ncbi:MAG: cobalamin B12-binding domain-containing protein [Phycisphaerales bacterium]|nr:cobalamin B12-binding domain-containing protein [Phycisphaerales bacterium]
MNANKNANQNANQNANKNATKNNNSTSEHNAEFAPDMIVDRLLPKLIEGNREHVRSIIARGLAGGVSSEIMAECVAWPIHETLHKLFRKDQIEQVAFNYATRALRNVVDHLQLGYHRQQRNGQRVMLFCGPNENEDLGGQLAADLLEAAGFEVTFGGGGVSHDEILGEVHQRRPNFLVLFASAASDAPSIRLIIDAVKGVNALPSMEIVVGGGVFNRAGGLADAIGASRVAKSPAHLVTTLQEAKKEITRSNSSVVNASKQRSVDAAACSAVKQRSMRAVA